MVTFNASEFNLLLPEEKFSYIINRVRHLNSPNTLTSIQYPVWSSSDFKKKPIFLTRCTTDQIVCRMGEIQKDPITELPFQLVRIVPIAGNRVYFAKGKISDVSGSLTLFQ